MSYFGSTVGFGKYDGFVLALEALGLLIAEGVKDVAGDTSHSGEVPLRTAIFKNQSGELMVVGEWVEPAVEVEDYDVIHISARLLAPDELLKAANASRKTRT